MKRNTMNIIDKIERVFEKLCNTLLSIISVVLFLVGCNTAISVLFPAGEIALGIFILIVSFGGWVLGVILAINDINERCNVRRE